MKRILFSGISLVAVLAASAVSAHAADLAQPPAVAVDPTNTMGYVEGSLGGYTQHQEYTSGGGDTYDSHGLVWSAAGRGVVYIDPSISIQGDVWTQSAHDTRSSSGGANADGGAALHASYHVDDNDLVGIFGSMSEYGENNIGVEVVHTDANYRIYGQIGWLHDTWDDPEDAYQSPYIALTGDYFINPNFVISGTIGATNYTASENDNEYTYTGNEVFWGAKAEYKLDNLPMTFFIEYKGQAWTESETDTIDPSTRNGTDHRVQVGFRIPIGSDSIQDLNKRDGLKDFNADFGHFNSVTGNGLLK